MKQIEEMQWMMTHLVDTWSQLTRCITQHPEKLVQNQFQYWNEYQKLFLNFQPDNHEPFSDKRFKNEEWQNNIVFNFIMKSYLLLSSQIENLINDIVEDESYDVKKRLRFFSKQILDAVSPTNFVNLNPDVLASIAETHGINILTGFKQLLEDMKSGDGHLNIKMTDLSFFKLGENIACTPGKIIYQNDIMQLIQYTATTDKVYEYPLLIIPPWINKYYILDLQQENSLVKWLVDQGFTVFMISWVNATEQHKHKQFSDYMFEGPLAALQVIKEITQKNQINILGYCIGGTLLGCMLAYLAKQNDSGIRSATFLTTLLDFSDPGEINAFIDEEQLDSLDTYMRSKGYLDGRAMAGVFNSLRANDLIWASFINNYLKGQKPKPFDLLYWNSDSSNIPAEVHSFYLRNMYLKNNLTQKNKLILADVPLDLSEINIPSYFLAAQEDHIVPWMTCYKGCQRLGGQKKFVLAGSGHVAGVINPPHRNKYGYRECNDVTQSPDQFLSQTQLVEGSWWKSWLNWQKQYAGELCDIKKSQQGKFKKLEDAPGSYVKKRVV